MIERGTSNGRDVSADANGCVSPSPAAVNHVMRFALSAYVALISAAGLLLLAVDLMAVPSWHAPWSPLTFLGLFALAIPSYRLVVAVRRGLLMSPSSIPLIAGAFLLPPGLAQLLAAVAPLGWALTRRVPPHKTLFNVANSSLVLGLAIHLTAPVATPDNLVAGTWLGPMAGLALASVHGVLSVLTVLFAIAIEHRRWPWEVVGTQMLLQVGAEAGLGLMGGLLAVLLLLLPAWAPALLLPATFVYLGQRALGQAERRTQRLVLASRVGRSVAASPAIELAFEAISNSDIREALRADGIALVPLGSSPAFAVYVPRGVVDQPAVRKLLAQRVAVDGQRVEIFGDERLPATWISPQVRGLHLTATAVPFHTPDQQLVGAVVVWRPVARSIQAWSRPGFAPEDLLLVETLADYAAVVVENARLRREAAEADMMRELTRLKDEFLGQVSHELRTPLTIIHAYTELIAENRLPNATEIMRAASEARGSTVLMARLVEDLLDTSHLDSGRFSLKLELVDLASWLRQTCSAFGQASRTHVLEVDVPSSLPHARVDLSRLGQVVNNLLTNAVRYSPDGTSILVSARAVTDGEEIEIRVRDHGPGIPGSEHARIFEKFYRGKTGTTQTTRGAGLGLAVARALVEAHHGSIGVDSRLGHGSAFWVRLPVAVTPSRERDLAA